MDGPGRFGGNRVVFGHIGERHERFSLRQRKLRPEWHSGRCSQSAERKAGLQDLATISFALLRHT
jgi:hypothetical protein